ncbi:MAG TPA: hypothetical protein VNJ07_02455 [Chitinophagales bacterium]|nr:hypothetical protein [Chitinophagales bacterium]
MSFFKQVLNGRKYLSFNHYFPLFAAAHAACFAVTRIPYFLNYDIPGLRMAANYYRDKIFFLLEGKLPVFENLPALYPLFLYACNLAGFRNNDILILQCLISLLSVAACQYLVNKYFPGYRWVFFISALIFYSSALCLNYNTRIEERSLLADVTMLAVTFLALGLAVGKRRFFILASLLLALMPLLRTQCFYVVPLVGILAFVLLAKKKFIQAALLASPFVLILMISSVYNKTTFGSFFFGKYGLVVSLAKVVFYLDDGGDYSPEVKAAIKRVNDSFSEEDKHTVRYSWSAKKLRKVFDIGNYDDKSGEFKTLFDTHRAELEKLAAHSRKKNPILYLKFIYTNFIYCFLLNYDKYYFYYNELVNRKYYIEKSKAFDYPEFTEAEYQQIYKEYTDFIRQKLPLPRSGIIGEDDYVSGFADENFFVKLNHYYQIAHAGIFSNLLWLVMLLLTIAFSVWEMLRARFPEAEILILQIPLVCILFNYGVVSLTIPPLDGYVYPTKFFVYFYPLSIACYLWMKYVKSRV